MIDPIALTLGLLALSLGAAFGYILGWYLGGRWVRIIAGVAALVAAGIFVWGQSAGGWDTVMANTLVFVALCPGILGGLLGAMISGWQRARR